jgi:hypothetical protein
LDLRISEYCLIAPIYTSPGVLNGERFETFRYGIEKPVQTSDLMKIPQQVLAPVATSNNTNASSELAIHMFSTSFFAQA